MKVTIIGSGLVGATTAYALLHRAVASEISLLDADPRRAEGEAMDLTHSVPFLKNAQVRAVSWSDSWEADAVVIAAGRGSLPGETRLDLLKDNASRIREICGRLKKRNQQPIVLVISNPVDVLTNLAAKELGWPRGLVLGSGTTLDTARLKAILGRRFGFDPHSIHGYVLGEHGDSEFVAWSTVRAGALPIKRWPDYNEALGGQLFAEVRDAAYEIVKRKRATYYAIGAAAALILEAVLRDQKTVLPVSVPLQGEYGLADVSLSLPCVLGAGGVERVLTPDLEAPELESLRASALVLRSALTSIA